MFIPCVRALAANLTLEQFQIYMYNSTPDGALSPAFMFLLLRRFCVYYIVPALDIVCIIYCFSSLSLSLCVSYSLTAFI